MTTPQMQDGPAAALRAAAGVNLAQSFPAEKIQRYVGKKGLHFLVSYGMINAVLLENKEV